MSPKSLSPLMAPTIGLSVDTYKAYLECYSLYVGYVEARRATAAARKGPPVPAAPKPTKPPKTLSPEQLAAKKRGANRKRRARKALAKAKAKAALTLQKARIAKNVRVIKQSKGKRVPPAPSEAPPVTMPKKPKGAKKEKAAKPTPGRKEKGKGKETSEPVASTSGETPEIAIPQQTTGSTQVSRPDIAFTLKSELEPKYTGARYMDPENRVYGRGAKPPPQLPDQSKKPELPVRYDAFGRVPVTPAIPEPEPRPPPASSVKRPVNLYRRGDGHLLVVSRDDLGLTWKRSGSGWQNRATGEKYYENYSEAEQKR